MKKIYSTPKQDIVKICASQLMAGSLTVNNTPLTEDVVGDAREDDFEFSE